MHGIMAALLLHAVHAQLCVGAYHLQVLRTLA